MIRHGLTKRQRQTLKFITSYMDKNDYAPTYDEIRAELGIASKSGINRLVLALEQRGLIVRGERNLKRNINIVIQKCPHCGWEFL
jgi:SOS-response transcriptional repressor LexA